MCLCNSYVEYILTTIADWTPIPLFGVDLQKEEA